MKKILSIIMLSSLALAGLFFLTQPNGNAQSQTTTVHSSTQTVLRRDNGQPLYYLTGDEIADDANFIGQRRITSFTISYRAVAPVNVIYRFYNNDLTAPITEEGRLQERGLLVKEIRETNLPAGDHLRTINLT